MGTGDGKPEVYSSSAAVLLPMHKPTASNGPVEDAVGQPGISVLFMPLR